jgi:hypothetical protein
VGTDACGMKCLEAYHTCHPRLDGLGGGCGAMPGMCAASFAAVLRARVAPPRTERRSALRRTGTLVRSSAERDGGGGRRPVKTFAGVQPSVREAIEATCIGTRKAAACGDPEPERGGG